MTDNGSPSPTKHLDELFVALQRLLPQHGLSRLLGKIAQSETPWLKDFLIRLALRRYAIDLEEALVENTDDYPSFNAFFTRQLKPDARPIDNDPRALISPADGVVSQFGDIDNGSMIQAKGHQFSADQLLGLSPELCNRFSKGSFATIYLSPRDYHRVHSPSSLQLMETLYIPGKLFSVNAATTRMVPGLFSRNERLVCIMQGATGLVAVVLVGALFVAGIETVWQPSFNPGKRQQRTFTEGIAIDKGAELGTFKFGSTVILLTENPLNWQTQLTLGSTCKMGQCLGYF